MKIVLATGIPELDTAIEDKVRGVSFVGSALYKEAVVDVVQRKLPDVIILSELLDGVTPMDKLILKLRTRFPDVRIIYVLKEDTPKEKAFLYQWMVFDVFIGGFTIKELDYVLRNPKGFADVAHELEILKPFINQTPEEEPMTTEEMKQIEQIDQTPYVKIPAPTPGTNTLYQQIISFWSVLDQSGKTFSITNTALALAGRGELKILLMDFNLDNPNVNLYYSFIDPNRNLGAIIDDVQSGIEITKDNFDDYLITHPTYHNIKILPGMILKMSKPDDQTMTTIFEQLIKAAEQNNFTTILIDTKAGLDDLTSHILRRSSKILLHINESPGSLNALNRCFDTEVGPLVKRFIDRERIIPIVTISHPDTRSNFSKAIFAFLERKPGATIPFSNDVRPSLYKGVPLLSKKHSDEMYQTFLRISNLIHNNLFKTQMTHSSTKTSSTKEKPKGGFLDKLFTKGKNEKDAKKSNPKTKDTKKK